MKNRRKFLVAIGAGALVLAAPPGALGQRQGQVWRIGFLSVRQEPRLQGEFVRGMAEFGYAEGRNLLIESRSADGAIGRLRGLADELVRLNVDVIVTAGTVASRAAKSATETIPIVMANSSDPVGVGLVGSLANPGGNITGLASLTTDLSPKLLEMLVGAMPGLSRVAVLVNPTNRVHAGVLANVRSAAPSLGLTILPVEARSVPEIEGAFSVSAQEKAGAIIVMRDGVFLPQARLIAQLAAKDRLATVSDDREYVDVGALMSYGPSYADQFRRAASYVNRILNGARPGDLPVEQPTQFEFVVSLKTARALGITIPQSMLLRADDVIQ